MEKPAPDTQWEQEFPLIHKIEADPKTLFVSPLGSIEKLLKKVIHIGSLALIAYIAYLMAKSGGLTGISRQPAISAIENTQTGEKILLEFLFYRNMLYFLSFLYLLNSLILTPFLIAGKQFAKLTKIAIRWVAMITLITFSYALSGLVVDLINIAQVIRLTYGR